MKNWKDILVMFGIALSTTMAWHTFRWYMINKGKADADKIGFIYTQQDTKLARSKDQYVKSLEAALNRSAKKVISENGIKAYKQSGSSEEIKMYKSE